MRVKKMLTLLLAGVIGVSALTGCGLNKDQAIAVYGDKEIPLGIANFICRYQQAQYQDDFAAYFGEDCWDTDPYGSGLTMQESVKNNVMDSLHDMYVLRDHMDDYQVTVSSDEEAAIAAAVNAFFDKNSKAALNEMGAAEEIVTEVLTLFTIQNKMHEAIIAEADTNVSDEEANMRAYSMLRMEIAGYYDSSYNYISYTEEEIADIKATAEEIVDELSDPKDLESVAEAHEYKVTTGTYDADDSVLDADVKAALDSLKEGEISDLITTDSYLYIVRLDSETDEEATESNRQSIIKERQDTHFNEVLDGWQKDDGWTVKEKVLAKIRFDDNLTQIMEGSETESSESEPASGPEEGSAESETGSEPESSESKTGSEPESSESETGSEPESSETETGSEPESSESETGSESESSESETE